MNYKIEPATSTDISWIAGFEAQVYSKDDAVPELILTDWFARNPNGFSTIKRDGERIGHIDLLPLNDSAFSRFTRGVITEREIRGSELHASEERDLVTNIYVESLAVIPPDGFAAAPAIRHLLFSCMALIERVGNPERIENIIAVAATNEGQRLLQALGFDVLSYAKDRKDRHDLYAVQLAELLARLPRRLRRARAEWVLAEI
jgi:hypothetical protein